MWTLDEFKTPCIATKVAYTCSACTSCHSPKIEWNVISDFCRFGAGVRYDIQAWKTRVAPNRRVLGLNCFLCARMFSNGAKNTAQKRYIKRTYVNLNLFNLVVAREEIVRHFILNLVDKSKVEPKDVRALLAQSPEAPLCKLYHTQTRHAHDRGEHQCGGAASKSRFIFSVHDFRTITRVLRRILDFPVVSLDIVDKFINFKYSMNSFTNEKLDAAEVQGQPAFSNCRYVVSREKGGDIL